MTAYALYAVIAIVVLLMVSAIRILREYQRGVIFLLGRFWKVKGPGFIIVIPLIQQMVRVDLRTIVMDVPSQDVISRKTFMKQPVSLLKQHLGPCWVNMNWMKCCQNANVLM